MSEVDEHFTNADDSAFVSDENKQQNLTAANVVNNSLGVKNSVLGPVFTKSGQNVYISSADGLAHVGTLQMSVEGAPQPNESEHNQHEIETNTHVVIHDATLPESHDISDACLKSPITPLPPPTPSTPQGREQGFKYNWDDSAFNAVLPVRCKHSNGILHKRKFGSGMFLKIKI